MSKIKPLGLWAIFAAPLLIGLLSLVGLIAALLGDGAWDVAGWLGLAAPLATLVWALVRAPASRPGAEQKHRFNRSASPVLQR